MAGQRSHRFIESPIPHSKRPISPSNFIESPIKVSKGRIAGNLVASPQQIKTPRASDFIASPVSGLPTAIKISTKRNRPSNPVEPQKRRNVNSVSVTDYDDRFYGADGGFGEWSPERDYGIKDTVDWSITSDEIEVLKSKVVPIYWELLLESANTVVRVTERLYILQDWNRLGYLMVTGQFIQLISLGTPV